MTLAHSKALLSRLSAQLIGQRFAKLGASARRVLLQCQCTLPPVLEFGCRRTIVFCCVSGGAELSEESPSRVLRRSGSY
jgi:hypothetical protein